MGRLWLIGRCNRQTLNLHFGLWWILTEKAATTPAGHRFISSCTAALEYRYMCFSSVNSHGQRWKIRPLAFTETSPVRTFQTKQSKPEQSGVSNSNYSGNSGYGQNYHIWSFFKNSGNSGNFYMRMTGTAPSPRCYLIKSCRRLLARVLDRARFHVNFNI